jgi:predicted RNA-binding Zn ribbon-like protein
MMPVMFREGAGRLCLDFVRTVRCRTSPSPVEELRDAEALTAWVRQFVPVEPPRAAKPEQVVEARKLREAIYRMIVDGVGGCGRAARDRINRAARWPVPAPRVDAAGRVRRLADDPVAAALSLVARDALDLVISRELERVRECADPECDALFLDSSRPGRRRWCSMNVCGNKAKKSALRERGTRISL